MLERLTESYELLMTMHYHSGRLDSILATFTGTCSALDGMRGWNIAAGGELMASAGFIHESLERNKTGFATGYGYKAATFGLALSAAEKLNAWWVYNNYLALIEGALDLVGSGSAYALDKINQRVIKEKEETRRILEEHERLMERARDQHPT